MSCATSLRLLHSFPTSEGPAAARVPVVCWWAAIMWRCRLGYVPSEYLQIVQSSSYLVGGMSDNVLWGGA